jgi:hypothetical protein
MADVTQNVRIALSQTGAEEVGRKIAGVAKEQNTLKQFVREQRTEQRMQTFLFREAAGAALVLANALGNTSKEARQMTNALNAGFATFQGIDFVLGRALGPLGLVLGALAGVAAAMATVTNNSENMTKAIEEFSRRTESLDLSGKVGLRGRLGAAIGSREEALQGIQGARLANVMGGTQRNIIDEAYEKQLKNEIAALSTMADNLGLSVEQAKQLNMALRIMAEVNLPAVNKAAKGGALSGGYKYSLEQYGPSSSYFDNIPPNRRDRRRFFGGDPGYFDSNGNRVNVPLGSGMLSAGGRGGEGAAQEFDLFKGMSLEVSRTMESGLTEAFRGAFGEANNLLEQLAQNVIAKMGTNLFMYGLSFIPGVGPILSAMGGSNTPSVTGDGTTMGRQARYSVAGRFAGDRIVSQRARLGT